MEQAVYALEAEVENNHWWFVGRRRLLSRIIAQLQLVPQSQILDVGTGTGTNLRLLQQLGFADVTGLDFSDDAIYFCQQKGLGFVKKGDVRDLPFIDDSFDVIFATDIIEHIDDDLQALAEIRRVLKPGGKAILMVPAFQALWGVQDRISHHKRRYRLREFARKLKSSGLMVVDKYYFNYLLFIPIFLVRKLIDWLHLKVENENAINTPWLNHILIRVFDFDVYSAPHLKPPFGVSILAIATK